MKDKIFNIIFEDGSVYAGGKLNDPKWSSCLSKKKIKQLEVFLMGDEDKITLEGYDQYNFFIGARKSFNQKQPSICHIYGLGERNGIVSSYRITVFSKENDKYKSGDVTLRRFPYGKEGVGRTPTIGWKPGIVK